MASGKESSSSQQPTGLDPASDTDLNLTEDMGPIVGLDIFDMRDGAVEAAHSLLVKATISAAWHWRPIASLPSKDALKCVAAYVKTYRAAIDLLPIATYPDLLKEKVAIVLGVARAVMTALYKIEDADLIPGEKADALLKATITPQGAYRFAITNAATPAQRLILEVEVTTTEVQRAAVAAVHMCALGILPVQGYSLVMCNHHYLSDKGTQSFRAFQVIEKQHFSSGDAHTWFSDNIDLLRDALWHKSGHPVMISLKHKLASNPDIARKLIIAGCGSAASRLPALESELRAANSYRVLLQTVRGLFETYGGYLNYVALDDAINSVHQFKTGVSAQSTSFSRPATVPEWVNSRETALHYLGQMLSGHQDIVGYCYGFYVALTDSTETATGSNTANTLKTSYALKKLEGQSTASYVAGREAYADYAAAKRAARLKGEFNAPYYLFVGGVPFKPDEIPLGVGVNAPPVEYVPK